MPSAARASQVRRSNLALLVDLVRRHGPLSRSAIVTATGLTRSAVAGLLGELTELHLVVESPPAPDGSPGRPSPVVSIDSQHVGALAIEVMGDEIAVSIVGLDGTIVTSMRHSRPRRRLSVRHTITDVAALVQRVDDQRRSAGRSGTPRHLLGIGVSVPGVIRGADNIVVVAPNLGWVEADLARPLAETLGNGLPIRIGNDADLGARAESLFGAGVGSDLLLFVSGEVGVGGGVVIDGVPLVGHSGFAGEVGHLPVNPDGRQCRCGAIGCWETEVGEQALLRRAGLAEDGGTQAVERFLALADEGDPLAIAALNEEAKWLAVGLTGLINVLDPDRVVLAGLLGRVLPYVRPQLDRELALRRFHDAQREIPILAASLGAAATTVGAAELAFSALVDDPARVMATVRGA